MNIVCFGQQNWHVTWTAKQQLLTRLARRGHRVLYVDPIPLEPRTAGEIVRALDPARSGFGVHQVQDGMHVFTPAHLHSLPRRLHGRWRRLALGRLANSLGLWAPVALCTWPAQRWLMDAVHPVARIYLAFDDNAGFDDLDDSFSIHQRREEQKLLKEVDLALGVSPLLVDRFRQIQARTFLQENGVDVDDFSPTALAAAEPHPALVSLPRPRLGFVGQVDARLDQTLIEKLATELPEASIVLAGRVKAGVDFSRLRKLPNVCFTGFVDYEKLAGVYRELDVGLVPYVISPLTQASNPLKVYEYLAADLPVVSTNLAGLSSARAAIDVADTPEQFTSAVRKAVAQPHALHVVRQEVADAAAWQRRADELEERLDEARSVAEARRITSGQHSPRPDRHGRFAVTIEPRLDGKDRSVRQLLGNYAEATLSWQQNLIYRASRVAGLAYWTLRRMAHPLSPRVRRILVVRNGHLGDTVVFFPTLAALRKRFPEARIEVAVAPGGGARRLLEASPSVDKVLELDFFHQSRWPRLLGAMRLFARGYDLAVGGAWYFHLPEAVFSGARTRLGLYDGHPLQRYADRVLMLDPNLHEAENNLRLAELVCGPIPAAERAPHLVLDEDLVRRKAASFREKLGVGDSPIICIHAGSKRPSRRWPSRSFATFTAALLRERPELQAVLTGAGAEEAAINENIVARILEIDPDLAPRVHDATDQGDLLAVIGLYDSARLLVCNDTGVMHVARARKTPLLALIGPENDRRWGPYSLGLAPAVTVRVQVPGTPHGKWDCSWGLSLHAIEPECVLQHALSLLEGNLPAAPVTVAGRNYFPLHRDVTRLSFTQLAERGLRLPRVAVILPHDSTLLGAPAASAEKSPAALVAAAARGLRQQHYPNLDILLPTASPGDFDDLDCGDALVVDVRGEGPDAAWARVLAQTPADLLFPWVPSVPLSPTAIANRVAVHLRGPSTESADAERHYPIRQSVGRDLFRAALLYTQPAIESLLRQPMNSSRPLSRRTVRADEIFKPASTDAAAAAAASPAPA